MDILKLIISLVVHFTSAFVFMYLCDFPEVVKWRGSGTIKVKMPSVYDLNTTDDVHEVNDYIKKIVNPAYHYFILRKDLNIDEGCFNLVVSVIVQIITLCVVGTNVTKVFPRQSMPETLYTVLVIASTIAVACLGSFILYKRYKSRYAIKRYSYSESDLTKKFKHYNEQFDINEEASLNNFILIQHYNYLCSIEKSLRQRQIIMRAVTGIFGAIIVFFVASA